jgi:hypothetical protein
MPLLKYEFSYKKSDEREKRCIESAWIYADAEGLWEISYVLPRIGQSAANMVL